MDKKECQSTHVYFYDSSDEIELDTVAGCRRYIDVIESIKRDLDKIPYESVCLCSLKQNLEPISLIKETLAGHTEDLKRLDRIYWEFIELRATVKEHKAARKIVDGYADALRTIEGYEAARKLLGL